jgi:hypothetical protein
MGKKYGSRREETRIKVHITNKTLPVKFSTSVTLINK